MFFMSIRDQFKRILGLSEEEEEFEIEEEKTEEDEIIESFPVNQAKPKSNTEGISLGGGITNKLSFVLSKPTRYDECMEIANHLIEKKTVVLNLEDTAKDSSRRIVDFLSGVAFAMKGQIKKVSLNTYVIIPSNADFTGDLMDEIESGSIL